MKHALIASAATTCTLWTVTLASATLHLGGFRLHLTLLAGSISATIWLISLAGLNHMKAIVYHFDRGYDIGVRGVIRGIVDAANQRGRDIN
jgi:hypothetical protein